MTRPTALAISPHLDDAVFSAGGTLAQHVDEGWRVVIATLFTANVARPEGFALACQLDKGLSPDIDYMALRRAEDRAACLAVGAEPIHLPLLEAPHRGYDSPAALFSPPRPDDSPPLARAIALLLARYAPERIFGPQAVGGHVDHVLTRRALAVAAPGAVFWADWPYSDRADAAGDPLSIDHARKADACAAYASQLGYQFGGEAALRARLPAHERFDRA